MTGAKHTPPCPFGGACRLGTVTSVAFTPPGDSRQWTGGPDTSLNGYTPDTLGAGKLHLELLLHTPNNTFSIHTCTHLQLRESVAALRSPSNPSNSQLGQTGPVSRPVQLAICPQSSGPSPRKKQKSLEESDQRGKRVPPLDRDHDLTQRKTESSITQ